MSTESIPKNFQFHEWSSKTNFSFLSGASHPHEMIGTAASLGYSSLCVNDFDGVYGLARSYNDLNHLKKDSDTDLKLNYGAELHLSADHDQPLLEQKTIIINVLTKSGFTNLNKIITFAHRNSKNEACISASELKKFDSEGLFILIPMRGGLKFFNENPDELLNLKKWIKDRLYFGITKTFSRKSDQLIKVAYSLAQSAEVKILFTQDSFYAHRSKKSFHDLLTAVKRNLDIKKSADHYLPNGERSLHEQAAIWKTYSKFPNAQKVFREMEALNKAATFSLSQISYQYPEELIPKGRTAQSYLEEMTWVGARRRYGEDLPPNAVKVMSKELDLIGDLGFADYFLTVWDIVDWARSQGILCQGRGSAANSSVCFALGITQCDPTLFDLLFERFVSKERGDPPDIDVDFEHERREEVIQYIYRRYGRERSAMVANVITFRSKGALRAVGKVFGVSEPFLKKVSETVGSVVFRGKDMRQVLKFVKDESAGDRLPENLNWEIWNKFAKELTGFPRHMGLHSGGFIVSQNPLSELVPTEPATMEGRTIIQWAKDDIEELGFFKIDCLALGMLTAIRKCFDTIEECYGKKFTLYGIPSDDNATYSMIQRAKTEGTFQIESRAQMSMLPRLKPKTFYDLVIEIAIIRPGPIQGKVVHPYLKRRDGLEKVVYPHEDVRDILSKTHGVIIFQEQLMRVAIALGDFTAGEADALRKQIGSWNSKAFDRNLTPYMQKLVTGMRKRGISEGFIVQAFEQMKGFAHYGFPESHAISFAFIAYASSYLKCHYPAAFYTSVLNSQPMGFYSPHALLQAARRDDVSVLPISINDSDWDHKLELIDENVSGRPKQFAIRLGFRLVKGLSKAAVDELQSSRAKVGKWHNFEDFISQTNIYRDDYTAMASANAFSCINLDRFDALWMAEAVPFKELIDVQERKIQWEKKSELEEGQLDFDSFGSSLGTHPVRAMREKYWPYDLVKSKIVVAKLLEKMKGDQIVNVFGMLLVRQAPPSAKGMVFYTLEDETGFINLAFTPQVYERFYPVLKSSGFICVAGKLQKASGYHSILVNKVYEHSNARVVGMRKQDLNEHYPSGVESQRMAYGPKGSR